MRIPTSSTTPPSSRRPGSRSAASSTPSRTPAATPTTSVPLNAADDRIGSGAAIGGRATASGTYTFFGNPDIGGASGGGYERNDVTPVRAADHRSKADYVLTDNGRLTDPGGRMICNASGTGHACANAGHPWSFSSSTGWTVSASAAPWPGTYYAQTDVSISGNPGSSSNPIFLTLIAEGNISITGGPNIVPDSTGLLFVTDQDLLITGGLTVRDGAEGQILVREQASISGNATIAGQLLIEGAATASALVTANELSGSLRLTHAGTSGAGPLTVSGWRRR